jgi:hypothetical protein
MRLKNLTKQLYNQSGQNLSNTESWLQKFIAIKPYVKTGCMSNQQKSEFLSNNFMYKVYGEVMAKFFQKPDLYRKVKSA